MPKIWMRCVPSIQHELSLAADISFTPQIATQPSIWDSDNVEEYKELYIHPQWENWSAFDPKFRWTWREERAVRRKVDWKIMVSIQFRAGKRNLELADGCQVWVCIMFAALNIDRNNISNAVSDNMLDDLDLTKADYVSQSLRGVPHQSEDLTVHYQNIGQTISRVGFLVAELPSQLISKR